MSVFTNSRRPVVRRPSHGARKALIARGKSLDLGTPYVPVPGDPLEHHAAGCANVMCSAGPSKQRSIPQG